MNEKARESFYIGTEPRKPVKQLYDQWPNSSIQLYLKETSVRKVPANAAIAFPSGREKAWRSLLPLSLYPTLKTDEEKNRA